MSDVSTVNDKKFKIDGITNISDFLLKWFESNWLDKNTQKTFEKYYAGYIRLFSKRLQFFYKSQTDEVMKLIKDKESPELLEVGCGTGTESLWMALQGAKVTSIDIKSERLEVAQKRLGVLEEGCGKKIECQFKNVSVLDLPESAKYDIIWMEQAFHHLEPRDKVCEKISKILKPGGHVVISEANAWNLLIQVLLFKRRGFNTICEFTDENGIKHLYGDERVLTPGSMKKTFRKFGIECDSIRYFRIFPNMKIFNNFFFLEKVLPQFFGFLFSHYNYVGKKTK